ncbi:MAG: hypothetical protein QME57_00300 [Patescibacteria group bacterium]|nr:hypothetical protein [Patescibacteria group bacterium]
MGKDYNEKTEYLRIDEKENAIDSLHRAVEFLKNTKTNLYDWKWFIIAIHHATHCFMLVALQNTDLSGIWKEPEIRKENGLIDLFNSKNRLITFMEAFERIQDHKRMAGYVSAKPFQAEPYHKNSMKHLNNQLRNKFIHYKPMGWSIHNQYFKDIVEPILEIIEFLVFESGRCHFVEEQQNQIKSDLDQLRGLLKDYAE